MERELLLSIPIPRYRRDYRKTDAARIKYYEKGGKKLPLQYCNKARYNSQGVREPDGTAFFWREYPVVRKKNKRLLDFLVDAKTNERVIANIKQAGKPRVSNINGQYIWSGRVRSYDLGKMLGEIKDQFRQQLMSIKPIERFPLIIEVELHDTIEDTLFSNGQDWDVENRILPYCKAFNDILKKGTVEHPGCNVIPDDDRLHISGPPQCIFVPIENTDERKLVFNIFVDKRPVILNNLIYQKKHGKRLG